jgi:hypothetical protein
VDLDASLATLACAPVAAAAHGGEVESHTALRHFTDAIAD